MCNMRVLTPKMMMDADRDTLNRDNITSFDLMLKASKALYDYILSQNLIKKEDRILILCGPGNNGGDGLCLGHFLKQTHAHVQALFPQSKKPNQALEKAHKTLEPLPEVVTLNALDQDVTERIERADVIIDGLFGINLDRALSGLYETLVNQVNQSHALKISLDIPSGLNAYNGLALGTAFKADHTFIIQDYKTGNLLFDAEDFHGQRHRIEVGIKADDASKHHHIVDTKKLKPILPKRKINTHKYNHGVSLIIGGSKGMEGAPILSALAAYRSGAGLIKVLNDKSARFIHQMQPEIQIDQLTKNKDIQPHLTKKDAVLFGGGLGRNDDYTDVLKTLLDSKLPLIIDADGIDHLKKHLKHNLKTHNVLITPHVGELANLFGVPSHEILLDPFTPLKYLVETYDLNVLLKGPSNILMTKTGSYHIHTPNPALAKGGSGDVLAGIILSFIASGMDIKTAVFKAIALVNTAVDALLKSHHEASILPTDVINALSSTLFMLK